MNILNYLIRQWFPRRYCKWGLRREEKKNMRQLKAAKHLSPVERYELKQKLESDLWEWLDELREIDDQRLVAKAAKMDIDLDDIPLSVMPGKSRRSSMVADSSPPRTKAARMAAASVSVTVNMPAGWGHGRGAARRY